MFGSMKFWSTRLRVGEVTLFLFVGKYEVENVLSHCGRSAMLLKAFSIFMSPESTPKEFQGPMI
jgi:hypothetical protein